MRLFAICLLAGGALAAATPHDAEIEVFETTYRAFADGTGEIRFHQRLRSLTSQGRAAASQVQVPYVGAFQDMEFLSVKTVKKDGTAVSGDVTAAFDSLPAQDPLARSFTDTKLKMVIPPSLETGDAVEFEAVLHIHKWPKAGEFWFSHPLITYVPVLSETVVLDIPSDRKVVFEETTPGTTETANGRKIERWRLSRPESTTPSLMVPKPLFTVSSIPDWNTFGTWMDSLNQKAAEPTPQIRVLAAQLTAQAKSDSDKISALYSYVATKIRYVSLSFAAGRLQPHAATFVLQNAYGDCKDQTVLLSALLTSAGFRAHAVITYPGLGVYLPAIPFPDQFNHEFVAVESKAGWQFLDTSMGPVAPGMLAPGVRGRKAVVIGKDKSEIVEIPLASPVPSKSGFTLRGKVDAGGNFEGSAQFDVRGLGEGPLRRAFADDTEAEKEKLMLAALGSELKGATLRHIASSDPSDLTKPFTVRYDLSKPQFFALVANSMQIAFQLSSPAISSVQTAQKPLEPVPLESYSGTRTLDIAIDPSFVATGAAAVHNHTAFGNFDSEFRFENGHLILNRSLELKGAALAPRDWEAFMSFERVIAFEGAKGFKLERQSAVRPVAVTPLMRALKEAATDFERKDYEGAKRAYLEAAKIDPLTKSAYNSLGRVYLNLRDYDKAAGAFRKQIEVDPEDLYAYNNLGLAYRALKREDDAIVNFRKQIELAPHDRFAHENLSVSLGRQNQWEAARVEAATATEITPDDAAKWVQLGRAQIKTGQKDAAVQSFDRALAQVHDAMMENNVAYQLADADMQLDKAWQLVSGALDAEARSACNPETLQNDEKCTAQLRRVSTMLDTAGWTLFRQGKVADAEGYLKSSNAIYPRDEAAQHLKTVMEKLGHAAVTVDALSTGATVRVVALVDAQGKILKAESSEAGLAEIAKSAHLDPIAWPGHSLRSVRTLEFRKAKETWVLASSYVAGEVKAK